MRTAAPAACINPPVPTRLDISYHTHERMRAIQTFRHRNHGTHVRRNLADRRFQPDDEVAAVTTPMTQDHPSGDQRRRLSSEDKTPPLGPVPLGW
jgi:hypothetical protein